MKIGLDIGTFSYKRLVDQIVLISGDNDFVPAAKLARTEGIVFILDPHGMHINENLLEHIDVLCSYYKFLETKELKNNSEQETLNFTTKPIVCFQTIF